MSTSRRQLLWLWLPVVGYMALVFVLSSLPGRRLAAAGGDKPLHLLEYALLGLLLLRALGRGLARVDLRQALLAAGIASVYGLSDELHQMFVPGRHASLGDLAADMLGAHLACLTAWLLSRRRTHQ